MKLKGQVNRWFEDRGFGFISEDESNSSYFVHYTDVENEEELTIGDTVEFEPIETERGWKAINVKVLPEYTDVI
jgi:CspA family cold shock protein